MPVYARPTWTPGAAFTADGSVARLRTNDPTGSGGMEGTDFRGALAPSEMSSSPRGKF